MIDWMVILNLILAALMLCLVAVIHSACKGKGSRYKKRLELADRYRREVGPILVNEHWDTLEFKLKSKLHK